MKLLRYGEKGCEQPGILDGEGRIRSLQGLITDISGEFLADETLAKLRQLDLHTLPIVEGNVRVGPCVAGTSKIIGIGLNYADHAAETGAEIPTEPVIFMKATTAISGPFDDVEIPRGSTKTDWEVELVVVMGRRAHRVSATDGWAHVAGLTIGQDLSERTLQRAGTAPQFGLGKSFPGFGPTGPWLVTADEFTDADDLALSCRLDGEVMQDSRTSDLVFSVARLIEYVSAAVPMLPVG